jgi:hypothetical protein
MTTVDDRAHAVAFLEAIALAGEPDFHFNARCVLLHFQQ